MYIVKIHDCNDIKIESRQVVSNGKSINIRL